MWRLSARTSHEKPIVAIADNLKQGMIKASFQVLQIKFMQCSGWL